MLRIKEKLSEGVENMLRKFKISIDGQEYLVEMEEVTENAGVAPIQAPVQQAAAPQPAPVAAAPQPAPASQQPVQPAASGSEPLAAPMPGTVLNIMVKPGDYVQVNEPLLILEAMKLENEIVADRSGKISELLISKGQTVSAGDALMVIS